jgi:hypothetical protein
VLQAIVLATLGRTAEAESLFQDATDATRKGMSAGLVPGYSYFFSPRTGTDPFIAMSVFKPDQLPDLAAAKGHGYYLYQGI